MRRLLSLLVVLGALTSIAMAGPNAGGVLIVHDTGLVYCTDDMGPPFGGPIPTSCSDVDAEVPFESGFEPRIWKVYAAFPPGGSPRLQGLAWGMDITPVGGGYVAMAAGGLVNPGDFEVTQGGWPTTNGASIGQSFPASGTKTTLMTEVYWFAGYAYGGPSGTEVQYFCAGPHGVQVSMFVDDAPIRNSDPIADYGCLGFGGPGRVPCPVLPPNLGRCCESQGGCVVNREEQCTGTWTAFLNCGPSECPLPAQLGACCDLVTGLCTVTPQAECGIAWIAVPCSVVLCTIPQPTGRCCLPSGCTVTTQDFCAGTWTIGATCAPGDCPLPTGSCCYPDESCTVTRLVDCTGVWAISGGCDPNPCKVFPIEEKTWGEIKNIYR